ncbi:hypothetical protein BX78_17330 [Escherichia coli O26:H11 str. 2010C-4819]|nr:hypothetical protein BX78_17330 [Escherichia coli O26:H11 str. 2010C-4819]
MGRYWGKVWLFGAYLGQKRTYKERCKIDFFMVKMRSNILKSICSWTIFGNSVFLMLHGCTMPLSSRIKNAICVPCGLQRTQWRGTLTNPG